MPWTQPESGSSDASLGTLSGFQASLSGQGVSASDAIVTAAINAASSIVRNMLGGQAVSVVSNDQVLLDGDGAFILLLPEVPVLSVSSVTVDGVAWVLDADYRVNEALGVIESMARPFPRGGRRVTVTYTHGYDAVPDDIQLVVYRVARRLLDDPKGSAGLVQSESVGGYSVTYMQGIATEGLITPAESVILDAYRYPWVAA